MTNTVFTDSVDTLAIVLSSIGVFLHEPSVLVLGTLCFILSFGARLILDARIEKYLNGIRDKVNK